MNWEELLNPDWEVSIYPYTYCVEVWLHQGAIGRSVYVYPPNWLERLLGIKYEQKLLKAERKMNRRRDELNAGRRDVLQAIKDSKMIE